jgi:hypothetical protein
MLRPAVSTSHSVSPLCRHLGQIGVIRLASRLGRGLAQLLCRYGLSSLALRRLSANLYREERPVDDLSSSAPSVLEGYITETDLARQLKRSVRTLQRLAASQSGPPRIKIGRLIFYRIDSVRTWLAQQEKRPPTGFRSSGRHLRRAS